MLLMIKYALLSATVLMLVALGGCYSEHSGVINLALEGIMVVGGLMGVMMLNLLPADTSAGMKVLISIVVAAVSGILYSALLAFSAINLKADQTIGGTALNLLSTAIAMVVVKRYNGSGVAQTVGASCSGTIAATNCTESGVAAGTWRYSVTPANGNWRGTESAQSAAATVSAAAFDVDSPTVPTLPGTVTGIVTNFISGQTVTFRLDNATSGTVLTGSTTPATIPANGQATTSVTIPSGTTSGTHTIYAIGNSGDVASDTINVLTPQTVTTTAWDLRDASSGTESNVSDPIAFASDSRTQTTSAPTTSFAATRYLLVDYNPALPTNVAPTSGTFNFRFASAASNTSCFFISSGTSSLSASLALTPE